MVACGMEHTLVGIRGAPVCQGVVALGVLGEGVGSRGIDSKTGMLMHTEAAPGERLIHLARSVTLWDL